MLNILDSTFAWVGKVEVLLKQRERKWAWLAKRLGKSRATVSLLKHGKGRVKLTAVYRKGIAAALEVPEQFIFDKEETANPHG